MKLRRIKHISAGSLNMQSKIRIIHLKKQQTLRDNMKEILKSTKKRKANTVKNDEQDKIRFNMDILE